MGEDTLLNADILRYLMLLLFADFEKCHISYYYSTALSRVQITLRACLHGVGDPGLVGLVSFVFTLWGTQNKRNLPH